MKFGFSQQEIKRTAVSLGLPTNQPFINRRIARAFDLVQSNKVDRIDEDIFRVHSQYEEGKHYIVDVNHGNPSCDCPDNKRTVWCKHQIAARLFLQSRPFPSGSPVSPTLSSKLQHKRVGKSGFRLPKGRQEKQPRFRIIDDSKKSRYGGRWAVFDRKEGVGYVIYRTKHGDLECACFKKDCIHQKVVKSYLEKHGKRIVNECGTERAKALQDKLNAQLDSLENNGDGGQPPSRQLDASDPFQEAELLDIAQIEGRANGDLVHRLSNGEYVISYNGIMHLALKLGIEFTVSEAENQRMRPFEAERSEHNDTHTIIAYARLNGAKRVSGKPVNGSVFTAGELAKRNAARQLLPYPEIKALEHKARLEAEFSRRGWLTHRHFRWEKAKAKCLEIIPEFKLGIAIHDLVQAGKLEQKHPSDYDRIEWLMIYNECKLSEAKSRESGKDAETNGGGGNSPSSPEWKVKLTECQEAAKSFLRYDIIKEDLQREGLISKEHPREWDDNNFATLKEACEVDASLFGRKVGHWTIELEPNEKIWAWFGRYDFWLTPLRERCFWCEETSDNLQDCCVEWKRYSFKTLLCLDCKPSTEELTEKFDRLYRGVVEPSERSACLRASHRQVELPETEEEFIAECKSRFSGSRKAGQAEAEVTDDNPVDANAMPLESGGGKRMLQMDKDKNITLVEADGTSKAMTIKDVAFTFGSDVVMRLTQGIQVVGADISTVELD